MGVTVCLCGVNNNVQAFSHPIQVRFVMKMKRHCNENSGIQFPCFKENWETM